MNTLDLNTSTIEMYFNLLKNLSNRNKALLIEKLSKSMTEAKKTSDNSCQKLYGALELDKSSDEFIFELKNDRKFKREILDL